MSKRKQQPKAYYSQGQVVGDRHDQRQIRGDNQVSKERTICNEDYDLSWWYNRNTVKISNNFLSVNLSLSSSKIC